MTRPHLAEPEGMAQSGGSEQHIRGYVTRVISQVRKNLESEDSPNISRLRQQKLLLSEKLDILLKLDEELIDMASKDDLDTETSGCDEGENPNVSSQYS